MKNFATILLLIFAAFSSTAQDCSCPDGINNDNSGQPFMIYNFSKGGPLGICGYRTIDGPDTTYTQFILYNCADKTVIKEWGASKTCKMEKVKDTLRILDIYALPIGREFGRVPRPFFVHKYYYRNGSLQSASYFLKNYGKYNKAQIAEVMAAYKSLPAEPSEQTMHVANMLMWAYFSGSKEAEDALLAMPAGFGSLDEALSSEWKEIYGTYLAWKDNTRSK